MELGGQGADVRRDLRGVVVCEHAIMEANATDRMLKHPLLKHEIIRRVARRTCGVKWGSWPRLATAIAVTNARGGFTPAHSGWPIAT